MTTNPTTGSTLVSTLAGGPQVVTFALDELLRRGEVIREVIAVHLSPQASPRTARALAKLVYCSWVVQAFGALAVLLTAVRVWKLRRRSPAETAPRDSADRKARLAVFWLAALFLSAKTWVVILVVPSISRHMLPAGVFVPPLLAIPSAWS